MKKLLNTLFVSTQGAYLSKEGLSVLVNIEGETRLRLPIHTICGIACFGNVGVSPYLLDLCAKNNVHVSLFSIYGRFLARIQGPVSGNVLLRRAQYRRADNENESSKVAYSVLIGKIANSKMVLQRALRDHSEKMDMNAVRASVRELAHIVRRLDKSKEVDFLRGLEGDAARIYFGEFNNLITNKESGFIFKERSRRPPLDPVNALLSFLYTLLVHDVCSALEGVGLDPAVGFLHKDRPGRPSLALDLMEEFRPGLADRVALSLINRKQIRIGGFAVSKNGSVLMDESTRKSVIVAWQKRKQEEVIHPFLNKKMPFGLVIHTQARLLAKHIRGELDGYPPFCFK